MIETIGNTEKDERGNAYYGIDEDIRDRLSQAMGKAALNEQD